MPKQAAADPTTTPVRERKTDSQPRHAPRYRVFVHNDDVTPMEFVVDVLKRFFHKPTPEAVRIMWAAHTTNIAHVDTLPLEQAEFRVDQAHSLARPRKYPLRFSYEPEE